MSRERVERLATLIPPPRLHRHCYHAGLAPNSPQRAQVTALARPATPPSPARILLRELLQIRPDCSIGLDRKRVQRQVRLDPEPLERFVKLLRQAGMPERSPAAAQGEP